MSKHTTLPWSGGVFYISMTHRKVAENGPGELLLKTTLKITWSLVNYLKAKHKENRGDPRLLPSSTYWASHMLIWSLLVFISNMLLNFSCVTTEQRHQQIICWQVKRFSVNQTRIYLAQNIVFFYLTAQIPFTFLSLQSSSESTVCWLTLINTVCSEAGLQLPSEPLKISRTTIYIGSKIKKKISSKQYSP